jgi:hypothetical protein
VSLDTSLMFIGSVCIDLRDLQNADLIGGLTEGRKVQALLTVVAAECQNSISSALS